MPSLYNKYRPKKLSEIVGQPDAVRMLLKLAERKQIPHAIMFIGPSGCGKTTMARILMKKLECGPRDFTEVNCATDASIEMARSINEAQWQAPLTGKTRVWLLDEVQSLSRVGFAQQALLKTLEDPAPHSYFMLACTDPQKVIPTIRNRCTEIRVRLLNEEEIKGLVTNVAAKEGITMDDELLTAITESAEGSARKSLVLLEQVGGIEDRKKRLDAVAKTSQRQVAIDLCRILFRKAAWREVSNVLKDLDEEPEMLRRMVLGYASKVCLGGGKMAVIAAKVINAFRDHYFDCGKAGLVLSCFDVCHSGD